MKKTVYLLIICLLITFASCDSREEFNGLSLPFSVDDVEIIKLIHHTGDPSNAEQKWVNNTEDITYIHNMLSSEILIKNGSVEGAAQTDTLKITFCLYDGTGYTVRFDSYGVKKGMISSTDGKDFSYFTSADVCWIWAQLAKDYEAQDISIVDDPYATEKPVAVERDMNNCSALETMILDYLAAKEEDFRSEKDLNLAEYFAPHMRDTLENQLSWKVFRFEKLVRYSIRDKILWESFNTNVDEIVLNGNTATVTAYEYYEYELSSSDGTVSSRGSLYTFNCQKIDDYWYIVSIDTGKKDIEGLVADVPAEKLPELAGVN